MRPTIRHFPALRSQAQQCRSRTDTGTSDFGRLLFSAGQQPPGWNLQRDCKFHQYFLGWVGDFMRDFADVGAAYPTPALSELLEPHE